MKLSRFLPTCGSKASTSVYPNPACEFCWQCWATARQVAADASVAFMPGSARSYQPALKWHFCGLEGTKMDQHEWCSFLLGRHDSKSLTYCAHFWRTALQHHPTRSLEGVSLLEIAYLLALLLHFLGGLEGFLKFLLAQEVNHSHLKCDLLAGGVLLETGPYQTPTWMHLKGQSKPACPVWAMDTLSISSCWFSSSCGRAAHLSWQSEFLVITCIGMADFLTMVCCK